MARMNDKMGVIDDLPNEMLSKIFSYINVVERQRLEIVCKRWQPNIERMWCTIRKLIIRFEETISHKNEHECVIDKLEFISDDVSDLVIILKKCNGSLKGLDLSFLIFNWEVSKETYELIHQNRHLESIRLKVYMNEKYEELLGCLPTEYLQHLMIEHSCEFHTPVLGKFFHAVEHVLRKTKALTFLYVDRATMPILEIISGMNTLKSLHLGYLESSSAISSIAKLSNLEVISISSNSFTNNNFLVQLAEHCRKLRVIQFRGLLRVTHTGLIAIASLPDLRNLRLELPQNTRIMDYFSSLEEIYCTMCHRPEREVQMFLERSPNLKRCYFESDDKKSIIASDVTEKINQQFRRIATNAGYSIQVSPPTDLLEFEWNEKFN